MVRRGRIRGTLVILVGLLAVAFARPVHAQLAVAEAGAALGMHARTAVQTFLILGEAIIHTANWALDLTGYSSTGVGGLEEDVEALSGLIAETAGLLWDIRSLEAQITVLFGVEGAPDSMVGLQERLFEIRRWRQQRILAAQRLQTLQHTAIRIVGRIIGLLERILDIAGDKQGLQQLQAQLTILNHEATQTGVLIAAYQQVALDAPQEHIMTVESLHRINAAVYATMPRP